MSYTNLKKYFAIVLSLFMLSGIGIFCFSQQAQAEDSRGNRGAGRAPAQAARQSSATRQGATHAVTRGTATQQRSFMDSRYQHNHSYPVRGQSVRSLPRDHRAFMHGHNRYYSSHGVWYRSRGGRFSVVAPPFGLFVPFLPFAYTTIWISGIPYYYANDTYYTETPGGYVVVEPPQGEVSETPPGTEPSEESAENKMFIYPRKGQSEEQQDKDRYECHTWAVGQTNFDPTRNPSGIPINQIMQKRSDYQRAMASCLDARGYTAK
jgi:hypothetical protein